MIKIECTDYTGVETVGGTREVLLFWTEGTKGDVNIPDRVFVHELFTGKGRLGGPGGTTDGT